MPERRGVLRSRRLARGLAWGMGTLALASGAFVVVGVLLPGRVEVVRSVEVRAAPEAVFPFLNELAAWDQWAPWGQVESRMEGPASGSGARRAWDDPGVGSGSFTLTAAHPPSRVDYVVEVEEGALRFEGTLVVEGRSAAAGAAVVSIVTWTERADLGWNPLLGWTALAMDKSQGQVLRDSLERLRELVERRAQGEPQPDPRVAPSPPR